MKCLLAILWFDSVDIPGAVYATVCGNWCVVVVSTAECAEVCAVK